MKLFARFAQINDASRGSSAGPGERYRGGAYGPEQVLDPLFCWSGRGYGCRVFASVHGYEASGKV